MDRYSNLNLDLECDDGGVSHKAALFGGVFKKPSKSAEASAKTQDSLSANGELSRSNDSLTDNNNSKDKGGMFKGVFKKTNKSTKEEPPQDTISLPNLELCVSSDSLSDKKSSKDKSGVFGGMLKRSPRLGHARRPSQDLLDSSDSTENLSENTKESGGMFSRMFRKSPKANGSSTASQDDLSAHDEPSKSTENPNTKESGGMLHAMFKKPFGSRTQSQEDICADKELSSSSDNLSENQLKKDPEDAERLEENREYLETKPNPEKSNAIHQPETRKRSDALLIPPRPPEEEMKEMSAHDKKQRRPEETTDRSPREMRAKRSEAPAVPPKPSKEEMNRTVRHQQNQEKPHGDEADEEDEEKDEEEKRAANKPTKEKKLKHPNPFMPQAALKAASDDEGLKDDDSLSKEKKKEEEGKEKSAETKVKKPKRHNPFMPQVKAKVIQRKTRDEAAGNSAENEGPNRSLFDQLEDFRIEPSKPENSQDVEDLMEWWNTVESWEDTPQAEDMTEKEEAKAFAVTAEKVQKGIRVFNKLFTERAESLWQHVIDLNAIADGLDKFNKNTKIAQITGGSTSAIGGVATIAGLALAPVTMGTSLIVTAVGLGVATAGGLTSAGAGISNQVNNSMDRKKVEKIVEDYQEKIADLNKCLKFIKQGIENLRRFDLIKMKKSAYNQDFPALTSQFYEDGAMAGKAILINANEIMRVVQIANVAGSTAARAVQIASMATGVLTGLFVGMDIYFVAKDSKELKKGAKSEFAAKIREVATQLHDGLVELNSIREELQSTEPKNNAMDQTKDSDFGTKDKSDKYDSSSEDEIDRIKKAIKKDIESREYV